MIIQAGYAISFECSALNADAAASISVHTRRAKADLVTPGVEGFAGRADWPHTSISSATVSYGSRGARPAG